MKTTDPRRIRGVLADRSRRIRTDPQAMHTICGGSASASYNIPPAKKPHEFIWKVSHRSSPGRQRCMERSQKVCQKMWLFWMFLKVWIMKKWCPVCTLGLKGFLELYVAPFPLRCFFLLRILRGFLSGHYGCSGVKGFLKIVHGSVSSSLILPS